MNKKIKNKDFAKVDNPPSSSSATYIWHTWFVFLFGVIIYLNTLSHQFTQDDAIVIYDNMYTTQGISGIKGLFTKDTFFGFFKEEGKAKLVSGGRYRPLTPVMFAVEYQLVGNKPWLGHLINILLYGLLCMMIYKLLVKMICNREDNPSLRYLILGITLLYAAHPLHTEAIANIKGRDEIMSMLGSVMTLFFMLKYADTRNTRLLIAALSSFFVALLSKENAITFLAIIPLTLYYFRDKTLRESILSSLVLLAPVFLFLMIRASVLGNDFGGTPMELMNNPFLKISGDHYVPFTTGEKLATIMFTLGKYIQLLVFPHPLTHDYYPRQIAMMSWTDTGVIMSLLVYGFMIYIAIKGFRTKSIISYGILFYLITLSIVSNIIFPIGTNMSERFMFMPSLGAAIVFGYLLYEFVYKKAGQNIFFGVAGVILFLFSYKTISRNTVWENDFTLFTTDVKTSSNSAKVLNAAGGALTTQAFEEKDTNKKQSMLNEAIGYLQKAVQIHPGYKNAYLIMGNAYFYLQQYDPAIEAYGNALKLDPQFQDAFKNQAIVLREAGKQAGEKENNLNKAEIYLKKSYQMQPNDTETIRLLGVVYGFKGEHQLAAEFFSKVVQAEPQNAGAYLNLSSALRNFGDVHGAEMNLKKALELDPNILKKQ